MTEEKININYSNFVQKLKKYEIYPTLFEEDSLFNDNLRLGVASINENSGLNYDGSLVEHITRIAVIAYNINKQMHEEVSVNVDSLIKVCYLHQISKALIYIKNIASGSGYKFNDQVNAMKVGEYSLYLCSKFGISLTADEYEAILSIDKNNDEQARWYGNMLSYILKFSIQLSEAEARIRFKIHKA